MHTNTTGRLNTVKDTATWTADLRRARKREQIQTLLDRAHAAELPSTDLELLRAVLADGRTAVNLSALTGEHIRTVRRRIRKLTIRLNDPFFLYVLRHRDAWPASRRTAATAIVLHGLTLRDAAKSLGISLHLARKQRDTIAGLYETATSTPRPLAKAG